MPILRSLLGKREITTSSAGFEGIFEPNTASGVRVSVPSSLRVSTVYAAVRLIAESVSSLPVSLIKRDGARRVAQSGLLAELVSLQPNPEQDAPAFWRDVLGWMLTEGNAYVYVERDGNGAPVGLWPLPASDVTIGRTEARRRYYRVATLEDSGVDVPMLLGPESVLHFKAFGTGKYGLSPIRQVREAIGTALAAQEYMANFYENDATPGGVISLDSSLSDAQFDRMNRQWKESHQGRRRAHMMAILEGGAKWESVGLKPVDAAFIETQKWETTEIARAFGVPPHLIGDVERSTSWGKGIAEQGIGFVRYTLVPWITRLEWVTRTGLLAELDKSLRMKFAVSGLERGDPKARYDGYAVGKQWGWLSSNDIRALEDMDPIDGGDVYLQPLNMVPAGTSPEDRGRALRSSRARSEAGRDRVAGSFVPLIADADRQVATVERHAVAGLLKAHTVDGRITDPVAFGQAVADLYASRITKRASAAFAPVFASLADAIAREAADEIGAEPSDITAWVVAYTKGHVDWRVMSAADRVSDAATEGDPEAVTAVTDDAVENRPEKTGRAEAVALALAATRITWNDAGVERLRWVTRGSETCKMCRDLDGKVVGISEPFISAGDTVAGGEGQSDLHAYQPRFTPPLHGGCDCTIVSD